MKALLVMDMINEYIYGKKPLINIKKRNKLISNIKRVIDLAHKKRIHIIYVNSAFRKNDPILKVIGHRQQAIEGKAGTKIIEQLKPKKDNFILKKRGYDGFWKSNLNKLLKKLKIKEVYLVGQQTDCCIRETGVTAAHLGYKVYIIEDCCNTNRELGQKSTIRFMRTCVGKVIKAKDINF